MNIHVHMYTIDQERQQFRDRSSRHFEEYAHVHPATSEVGATPLFSTGAVASGPGHHSPTYIASGVMESRHGHPTAGGRTVNICCQSIVRTDHSQSRLIQSNPIPRQHTPKTNFPTLLLHIVVTFSVTRFFPSLVILLRIVCVTDNWCRFSNTAIPVYSVHFINSLFYSIFSW